MTATDDDAERIGTEIAGRYRVTGMLGKGGMGTVYRADDAVTGDPVAIKVLRSHLSASSEATARFRREALVGGKLDHPNCVGVAEVGTCDDGAVYLTMELLDGQSLSEVLEHDGPLPWQRALHVARHILSGLAHAHAQLVVHRDVKPDNVFLCPRDGDADFARVLDFGIAKLVGDSGPAITQAGLTVGTPDYLSPEQAAGGDLDGRSDLYSLSAVLFEMLTGRPPFQHEEPLKILMAHAAQPPPRFAEVAPATAVPEGVEALVREGLAKRVGDRISSAAAYIARIDALLAPPAPPPAPSDETVIDAGVGELLDGRYRLETLIGRGAMGRVYRAFHVGLGRPVALKMLDPRLLDDDEAQRRFEREAQVMARLRHPNCVAISDFGTAPDGGRYLVMELAEGENLADMIASATRLPAARACHVMRHVLRGLAHAHALGIVHRDLKPTNVVLVTEGDDPDFAKILDFGLARMIHGGDRVTRTGIVTGSPTYLAPELLLDRGFDARVDLYAASVMLFEMLAGRPPFEHDEVKGLLRMHMTAPVPRFADVAPGVKVPHALEELIRRGLGKRPEERPASADVYLAELARAARDDGTMELSALDSAILPVVTPPPVPRSRPPLTRRQLAIAGAAGAVLLVVVLIALPGGGSSSRSSAVSRVERAIDQDIDVEPHEPRELDPEIAKALALSRAGRGEDAASRLRELRKRRPRDPMVPYALGRSYARLNWPKQAIDAYRDAIRMDSALREDEALIRDLAGLLASKSSWHLAARALEHDVGAAALPVLTEQAEQHRDATVRSRAAKVRDSITP